MKLTQREQRYQVQVARGQEKPNENTDPYWWLFCWADFLGKKWARTIFYGFDDCQTIVDQMEEVARLRKAMAPKIED